MKRLKWGVSALLVSGFASMLHASSTREAAYQAAMDYLTSRGEMYFTFHAASKAELYNLSGVVSIDNVIGDSVLAYANSGQFAKFFPMNIPFEVLLPPGLEPVAITMYDAEQARGGGPREWDSYPTFEGLVAQLNKFASDYPTLCKVEEMGKSLKSRQILAIKISDNVAQHEKEPVFFYQSTIHGDELCGYVSMLHLADYLLKNYATDARVKKMVDNMEIWINPDANPDGTYKGGNNTVFGSQRGNSNGVDLNRSFPSPTGKTEAPEQHETRVYMDFSKKIKPVLSADFHGGAELICYVWGCWNKTYADEAWWKYVCAEWVKVAKSNGASEFYSTNAYDWYKVEGERMNWESYVNQCRDVTVEIASSKQLPASSLLSYWNRHYKCFLDYLEQALYGIQGTVTDSVTGAGLEAQIFVDNHDVDNTQVFSRLPFGDYYRVIMEGTYNLTVTALDPATKKPSTKDYFEKKITGVKAVNKQATVLDIKLRPTKVGVSGAALAAPMPVPFTVAFTSRGVIVRGRGTVAIYDARGTLVKTLAAAATGAVWDGRDLRGKPVAAGCYIVKAGGSGLSEKKSFIYTR